MKNIVPILILVLICWISGSSYWYVCKIRDNCHPVSEGSSGGDQLTGLTEADSLSQKIVPPGQAELSDSLTLLKEYIEKSATQKVYFDFAKGTTDMNVLPDEYFKNLKKFADIFPETIITITGHADSRGTPAGNSKFSQMRADFVKDKLVQAGINANQIQTASKSDSDPAASNLTEEGRALNRRAEIIIKTN